MNIQDKLQALFKEWSGEQAENIEILPASGSVRKYFRLRCGEVSALGAYNPDIKENLAFKGFTHHFLSVGLPVPSIFAEHADGDCYLIQDLGDTTLYNFLTKRKSFPDGMDSIRKIYEKVLCQLPGFQIRGNQGLDYSLCYPRSVFDAQSMSWDLNYFKYYFLKLTGVHFHEQNLENDFSQLVEFLTSAPVDYFMFRDFQSRNIMLHQNDLYYIDYQGGRKGPLQYDLASLLWDAKADLPNDLREQLLLDYLEEAEKQTTIDRSSFLHYYYGFVYLRIMQALGAYGFRGFYERKEHFLLSIPYAVNNLRYLLKEKPLPCPVPELSKCLHSICASEWANMASSGEKKLKVSVLSFSYKKGLPRDLSGHGGGFVFDCRSLPNPGRCAEYRELTGLDQEVADFLNKEDTVHEFYDHTEKLIFPAIENYMQRQFHHLMISYGCTGGQHRSVWCSQRLADRIASAYDVEVVIKHREL